MYVSVFEQVAGCRNSNRLPSPVFQKDEAAITSESDSGVFYVASENAVLGAVCS